MKKTQAVSAGIAFVLAITFSLHAQDKAITVQSIRAASANDLNTMLQAVEATTPVPAESIPRGATFWSAQHPNWPPMPGNINNFPAYSLGSGVYLLADQDFDYVALEQQNTTLHMLARAMGLEMDSQEVAGSSYTINTNGLWLDLKNVADGLAYLSLHNATNEVYSIWSTTNLLAGWNVAAEVWPTNSAVTPFTVPTLDRQSLFLRAQDWTGVDDNGDGIPDWWIWKYFGTLDLSATNLDSRGNTLLYDYQNGIDPNIIAFTLSATNLYVNQTTVPLQINLQGGAPSYIAVLVSDTNLADADWQAYTGTNITVNLGSTDGVYVVWVGLRGLPADAQQTWDTGDILFTLDRVPPTIVVTNPVNAANAMAARPYLQLQGHGNEPLSVIACDLANAAGLFTNQPGFVTDQVFDTNRFDFTTNFFQCYDIPLTNGLNTITLRAMDRAGNITTTNVAITLDYSLATNPPTVNLIWPQDGMQISGANFTLRGTLDDETAQVTAQIVDANGNTNTVAGLVERGGMFWVENLPLTNGDNTVTVTATDAAGNVTTTNLTVSESDVVLTIDGTPTGDGLYQPRGTVCGTVSDPDYTVWVNGVEVTDDYWSDGGTWYWQAENVPVYGKGTATFDAVAYPADPSNNFQARSLRAMNNSSSSTPPANASAAVEMGSYVAIVYHDCNKHKDYSDNSGNHWISSWTKIFTAEYQPNGMGQWVPSSYGGTATDYGLGCDPDGCNWRIFAYAWSDTDETTHYTDSNGNDTIYPWINDDYGVVTGVPDEDLSVPGGGGYPMGAPPGFIYHYCANGVNCHLEKNGGKVDVTVSAHTAVKLYTGGKAVISRQNLFGIHCWADRYDQSADNLSWNAPWLYTTATRLDPTSLTVLGKTPGSDGNVWITLPDNSQQDITVTAPAKHYDANAGAQKYKLTINANSTPLDPNKSVVTNCVGQKITFGTSWDQTPPGLLDNLTTYIWDFSGKFVNHSTHPCNSCSVNYDVDLSLMDVAEPYAWWVTGGDKNAYVHVFLHFSNGQSATVPASGQFSMYRPQFTSIANQKPVEVKIIGSRLGVGDGSAGDNSGDMQFDVLVQTSVKGNVNCLQLASEDRNYDTTLVTSQCFSTGGQYWLDNNQSIAARHLDPDFPSIAPAHYYDSPSLSGQYSVVNVKDSFKTYVQFAPADSLTRRF